VTWPWVLKSFVCSNACNPFHAGSVQSIKILPSILLQPRLTAELELLVIAVELLLSEFSDDELGATTTSVADELVATAEFVLLEELVANKELLAEDGIGLVCVEGVAGGVPVPPPHALKIKIAAKSSERGCIFMLKTINPLIAYSNLPFGSSAFIPTKK
jgi:hypothetical protein